jgi:hypothetical protein
MSRPRYVKRPKSSEASVEAIASSFYRLTTSAERGCFLFSADRAEILLRFNLQVATFHRLPRIAAKMKLSHVN